MGRLYYALYSMLVNQPQWFRVPAQEWFDLCFVKVQTAKTSSVASAASRIGCRRSTCFRGRGPLALNRLCRRVVARLCPRVLARLRPTRGVHIQMTLLHVRHEGASANVWARTFGRVQRLRPQCKHVCPHPSRRCPSRRLHAALHLQRHVLVGRMNPRALP